VAEELIIFAVLAVAFFFGAFFWAKENPLRLLRKPIFTAEALTDGFGGVIHSFAYAFAPASIILAATRSSSVFWSVISGNRLFHEKDALVKLISLAILIVGILLLL
jgi:drug/metabolite transporter (DMT)-like permease